MIIRLKEVTEQFYRKREKINNRNNSNDIKKGKNK